MSRPILLNPRVRDTMRRPLTDLRISLTDRCNFRCVYCMPKEIFGRDYQFFEREELLTFEEITRVARIGAGLGVEKIRLTGGEPLLRRGIEGLIAMLAEIRTPEGRALDLALTTNGSALPVKAAALQAAGLNRVTVSLDSLDDERFQAINDVRFPVARVLDGIAAADAAGLGPVKVNAVIKRSVNDDEILPLAEHFRGTGHTLRFIEYMDVGASNGWLLDEVVPSREIVDRIHAIHPLAPVPPRRAGETAKRWRYIDGAGEIGVISSVTDPFCGACSRARISPEGKLFTCLFAHRGFDLRALLRSDPENGDPELRQPATDDEIAAALQGVWRRRDDRYSELRSDPGGGEAAAADGRRTDGQRIEMSYIGG